MYSDGDPKALRMLAQKAQKFETVLNDRYKAVFDPDTPPIDIYVLRSQGNVAKLMGGSKTTAGFYKPDTEGSIILSNREGAAASLTLIGTRRFSTNTRTISCCTTSSAPIPRGSPKVLPNCWRPWNSRPREGTKSAVHPNTAPMDCS
jgi:hypothetical protein